MYQAQLNRLLIAVILFHCCFIAGCHRSYYRRQADAEAERLVAEKAVDPRWDSVQGTIDIDPQSRMFNPFSKDHPPIPPDDATSHQLMHCVDGKEGYPHWHANGDTDAVENPVWKAYLPTNEQGQVVLDLERAYQLALIHSPDYQQQRETLYQSALNVSLERFGFDSQLFTGYNSFVTTQGRFRGGGNSSTIYRSQLGATGGGATLRRLGITGTNFVVGLANTILFNVAGNNTQSATTLIDFSVIQPLLRGAGRERIMESLTQSERTLLANIRQLERFKRGFFLNIAMGRNPGGGPTIGGNFLGNPGAGGANAGGFYGLLLQQQQIRNQEINVRQLEAVLAQFEELFRNDRLDAVQLNLFQTTVYGQQNTLLTIKTAYETQLDQFKTLLGLPPDLEVVIEDDYLDQFKLISDQLNDRLINIGRLRQRTGEQLGQLARLFEGREDDPAFQWPDNLNDAVQAIRPFIDEAQATVESLQNEDVEQVRSDLAKLEQTRDDRLAYLADLRQEIDAGRILSGVDRRLFQPQSIPEGDELRKRLSNPEMDELEFIEVEGVQQEPQRSILKRAQDLDGRLATIEQQLESFPETEANLNQDDLFEYIRSNFQEGIPGLLTELNNLTFEMTLVQAFARSNSIEITDISIDAEQAIRIARCLRRDWMNARASLVDQFRNIEFVADQLEAGVDLVFEGDVGNVGDNPFRLRYETGQLRAGFRFDAPIVRLAERNQYRQALIQYQQARRNYYQFEDSVKANLRNLVRLIRRNKVIFELDRQRVQNQITGAEINRLELDQPVPVGATSSRLGTSTARNLTDAITNLNQAQNSFVGTWLQYEVLRRNLDFDMGTMLLDDANGTWLDPGVIDASIGVRAAAMMGIELDCQFCENIGTSYLPAIEGQIDEIGESEIDSEAGGLDGDISPIDLFELMDNPPPQQLENLTPEQRQLRLQLEQQRLNEEIRQQNLQRQKEDLRLQNPNGSNGPNGGLSEPSVDQSFIVPRVVNPAAGRTAVPEVLSEPIPAASRPLPDASAEGPEVTPAAAMLDETDAAVPKSFSVVQPVVLPSNQGNPVVRPVSEAGAEQGAVKRALMENEVANANVQAAVAVEPEQPDMGAVSQVSGHSALDDREGGLERGSGGSGAAAEKSRAEPSTLSSRPQPRTTAASHPTPISTPPPMLEPRQ